MPVSILSFLVTYCPCFSMYQPARKAQAGGCISKNELLNTWLISF